MNREERRRAARRLRVDARIRDFAADYRCPDCNADTRLNENEAGVHSLTVFHDDTCPAYNAMNRSTP